MKSLRNGDVQGGPEKGHLQDFFSTDTASL